MNVWLCPRKGTLKLTSSTDWNQVPSFECPEYALDLPKTPEDPGWFQLATWIQRKLGTS